MERRRWGRTAMVMAMAGVIAAGVSCSLILGGFKECETEADCAGRITDGSAFNYVCGAGNYCLPVDKRCVILGPKTGDAWVWGAIMPKTLATGGPHQWGPSWESAIDLVVNELNSRIGVSNKPIRVYSCDSQSSATVAGELAEYLVSTVRVPVIISDGSGDTIAESKVTIKNNVLLVAGAATSPELTSLPDLPPDGGSVGLVWRTTPSDALQAPIIARQILDAGVGVVPKVFVFYRNDAFGQGLSTLFLGSYPTSLPDGGGSARSSAFVDPADLSTVNPALTAAETFRPDVMVVIGFPAELVAIVNGVSAHPGLASASWFFTQNAKFPALFTQVDAGAIQGARGTSPSAGYDNSGPSIFFRQRFEQTYGVPFNSVVDLSNVYDAALLVAIATNYSITKDGAPNGLRMAEALTKVSRDGGMGIDLTPINFTTATSELNAGREIDIEGASGHLNFNSTTGEAAADYEVWKIVGNNFVTQYSVSP